MKLIILLLSAGLGSYLFVARPVPVENHEDLATALLRAGLSPEAIAAAGCSAADCEDVIEAANFELVNADPSLAAVDASYASARVEHDRLKRLIQSGKGSDEDVASYQTAKTDLENAEAAREALMDDLFEAACGELTEAQAGALTTIRGNAHWGLPMQYLAADRTQQEWVDLRDALANVRISADFGEEPAAECVSMIDTCDLDAGVSSAKSGLDTYCSAVEAAWDGALE